MKYLSNENIIHVKNNGIEYIQFKRLLEYQDKIVHAYTIGIDKNYRKVFRDENNIEIQREQSHKNYKDICNEFDIDYDKLIYTNQKHTDNIEIIEEIKDFEEEKIEVDALCTNQKGITLSNPDGTLNRKNLGELLFQNPTLLKKQEDIIYPLYIEETQKIINSNPSCNIILNATVLYKTPQLMNQCDFIIFVKSSAIQRFFRVCKRDNIKIKNILQRFYSQKNLYSEYKATNIPIIEIKNSSNINKLKKQVEHLLKKLK